MPTASLKNDRPTPSDASPPKPRAARLSRGATTSRASKRRALKGFGYALPTALFVLVLFVVPLFLVGDMSLSDWPLLTGKKGFNFPDNFTSLADNDLLWPAVGFTLKYTLITTVILLGLALLIALLVQEASRWNNIIRVAVLIPSALGLASAALLFWGMYSPAIGPFSPILESLGLIDEPVSFLGDPNSALMSTVFLVVWRYTGFYMLILMVGLQGIPKDVYEAAIIDGANRWQTFFRITLPLLRSSLALTLIMCVTGSLLAFDQFFILTKGGPDNSTVTVVQLIYQQAFQKLNLGTGAALSVVVLLVLLVINVLQFKGLRGSDKEK